MPNLDSRNQAHHDAFRDYIAEKRDELTAEIAEIRKEKDGLPMRGEGATDAHLRRHAFLSNWLDELGRRLSNYESALAISNDFMNL